jgi:hypothetical protein
MVLQTSPPPAPPMSWDIDSSAAGRSCCTRQTTLMIFAAALDMKMIWTNKFIIDNQKKPQDLEDDDGSNRYHESGSSSSHSGQTSIDPGVESWLRVGGWELGTKSVLLQTAARCWCCLCWCMRQEMEMEIIALMEMENGAGWPLWELQQKRHKTWLDWHWLINSPYHSVFSVFCFGEWNFAKFRPEKYDFDLYKGFYLWKKNGTNSPDFGIFFSKSPDFYDKF